MIFQTQEIGLIAGEEWPINQTCNCLIVETATGIITVRSENATFECVLRRMYRGDTEGKLQAIKSTITETVKITFGNGIVAQTADIASAIPIPLPVKQEFGSVMDDHVINVIGGGIQNGGGWAQSKTLAIIVAASPNNTGYVWIQDGNNTSAQEQGIPLSPGQSIELPGDYGNSSDQGQLGVYNPNVANARITVTAFLEV